MRVGFTGTREGMTPQQIQSVGYLVKASGMTESHDGDCKGADHQFNMIVKALTKATRIGHPPTSDTHRAFGDYDILRPEKGYLARDRDIVVEIDVLIATPKDGVKRPGGHLSGTWYTIDYAIENGIPVLIVWPDGRVKLE